MRFVPFIRISARCKNEKHHAKQVLAKIISELNGEHVKHGDELVMKWMRTHTHRGARRLRQLSNLRVEDDAQEPGV